MIRFSLLLFIVLIGCGRTEKTPISQPDIDSDFYQSMYVQVHEKLADDPDNSLFLRQKIYYAHKLEWPEDALSALDRLENQVGLTDDLMEYYCQYYLKYQQYDKLKALIGRWESQNELDDELYRLKVLVYVREGNLWESGEVIRAYLDQYSGPEQEVIAARSYLELGDTLRSIYHYSRLARKDPQHSALLDEYAPLLAASGYYGRAREIILSRPVPTGNFTRSYALATSLYNLGQRYQAKNVLRDWTGEPRAVYRLADWFRGERAWDSATVYVNRLIQIDSSRSALFLKGEIYEQRGWLNSSYELFSLLAQENPGDSASVERAEIVSQKIAYLRNQREAARQIRVLELSPKKDTIDE